MAPRRAAPCRQAGHYRAVPDLAIRYGSGNYPGLRCDVLFEKEVFPVCSPALLEGPHPLKHPEDLQSHTLLRLEWSASESTWPDWAMWLRAAGVENVDPTQGPGSLGEATV